MPVNASSAHYTSAQWKDILLREEVIKVPENTTVIINKVPEEIFNFDNSGTCSDDRYLLVKIFQNTVAPYNKDYSIEARYPINVAVNFRTHSYSFHSMLPFTIKSSPSVISIKVNDLVLKMISGDLPNPLKLKKGETVRFEDFDATQAFEAASRGEPFFVDSVIKDLNSAIVVPGYKISVPSNIPLELSFLKVMNPSVELTDSGDQTSIQLAIGGNLDFELNVLRVANINLRDFISGFFEGSNNGKIIMEANHFLIFNDVDPMLFKEIASGHVDHHPLSAWKIFMEFVITQIPFTHRIVFNAPGSFYIKSISDDGERRVSLFGTEGFSMEIVKKTDLNVLPWGVANYPLFPAQDDDAHEGEIGNGAAIVQGEYCNIS